MLDTTQKYSNNSQVAPFYMKTSSFAQVAISIQQLVDDISSRVLFQPGNRLMIQKSITIRTSQEPPGG